MVQQITPRELARRMANGHPVCLLDVREPWEHELAALPDSRLIPLGELALRAGEVDVAEGALIVAYCHHGIRSLSAARLLEQAGVRNVVSLAGGIDAWSCEVDPTIRR